MEFVPVLLAGVEVASSLVQLLLEISARALGLLCLLLGLEDLLLELVHVALGVAHSLPFLFQSSLQFNILITGSLEAVLQFLVLAFTLLDCQSQLVQLGVELLVLLFLGGGGLFEEDDPSFAGVQLLLQFLIVGSQVFQLVLESLILNFELLQLLLQLVSLLRSLGQRADLLLETPDGLLKVGIFLPELRDVGGGRAEIPLAALQFLLAGLLEGDGVAPSELD